MTGRNPPLLRNWSVPSAARVPLHPAVPTAEGTPATKKLLDWGTGAPGASAGKV